MSGEDTITLPRRAHRRGAHALAERPPPARVRLARVGPRWMVGAVLIALEWVPTVIAFVVVAGLVLL